MKNFTLKRQKTPHSPQKKRPKRENGIDVFEIRRRRKKKRGKPSVERAPNVGG